MPRAERPVSLYDLTLDELVAGLGQRDHAPYRARQLYEWAYTHLAEDYAAMTPLPKSLRAELAAELPISTLSAVRDLETDDGETIKTLYRTFDGEFIETVLMLYPDLSLIHI